MFVLINLMCHCLQREAVLPYGIHQASAPAKRTQIAINKIANPTPIPIAPLHAPIPRLNT
ncbi:MAG: hypothetical protein RLZZ371_246 [Pseudomonadota bacterium]